MTTLRLVWTEMRERPGQLLTSFVSITLAISVIVGIKTVAHFSEKAVARQLDELGANVLILPKGVSVTDYYTADVHGEEMPEDYVDRITTSALQGVDNLSPKLTAPMQMRGHRVLLTGILPKNEFASKPLWAKAGGIFTRPEGCGTVSPLLASLTGDGQSRAAVRRAVVEALGDEEVLIGSDIAAELDLQVGDELSLQGHAFTVRRLLPETGTVDDDRVFAHLHTVQRMLGKPGRINGIEMVGCCREISKGLITGLNQLLPDARVVTIKQIVTTQSKTNSLMEKLSLIFLVIIVVVGGGGIANYTQSNVQQRLKEIGTLMAMGMPAATILAVFLCKALFVGVAGAVVGYVTGTALAVVLGPQLAQVSVLPMASWLGWSLLLSVGISILASLVPAARAARLDPVIALREL